MPALILRFVLLGSLIGGGVFLTVRNLAAAPAFPNVGELARALASLPLVAILTSFLSLPIGGLYGYLLQRHTKQNPVAIVRMVLGGCVSLVVSMAFGSLFSFGDAPGAYTPWANLVSWACAGALGGSISALAVGNATYPKVMQRHEVPNEA